MGHATSLSFSGAVMTRIRLVTLLLSILLISGCKTWPIFGQGGMAEHHRQTLSINASDWKNDTGELPITVEYDLLMRHLDVLVLEGAELCFPATVQQSRLRQDRILRAISGGLTADAVNDMVVQRMLLNRLERQMDYVLSQSICVLPSTAQQTTPGSLGRQIDELLNADNQFAVDSAEINPKYMGRLAEAAALLKEAPGYHLQITGHTDAQGDKSHNQSLSLARAEQVSRYLKIFGLDGDRITVSAVGSDDPLFNGVKPEINLTNRRVSFDLIEKSITRDTIGVLAQ